MTYQLIVNCAHINFAERFSWVLGLWTFFAEFLAVDNQLVIAHVEFLGPVYPRPTGDRDLVPHFYGVLGPADFVQSSRRVTDPNPLHNVPLRVFHVEKDLSMGIRKNKPGHRSRQSDRV